MDILLTTFFYIAISVIASCAFSWAIKVKKANYGGYLIIFLLLLVLLGTIAAFREGSGSDSLMYRQHYESQNFTRRWSAFEGGYIALNVLLYKMGFSYRMLFLCSAFVQSFFVFKTIEHEKEEINVKLALFIYMSSCYFISFNIMRQMLAVSMCLYAILCYLDKKLIKSVLLVLLAAQFHKTAYIVLLVFFAKIAFGQKSKLLNLVIFSLFLFLVFNKSLLNEMYKFFTGRYTGYLSDVMDSDGNILKYYLKLFPLIFLAILHFKNYKNDSKYYVIFGLYLTGVILESLDYLSNTQVGRIGHYFSYLDIVLFPFIAEYKTYFGKRVLASKDTRCVIYMWFLVLFFYNYVYRNFGELFPYQGFFG